MMVCDVLPSIVDVFQASANAHREVDIVLYSVRLQEMSNVVLLVDSFLNCLMKIMSSKVSVFEPHKSEEVVFCSGCSLSTTHA